jgi:hypothetical protein
MTESKSALLEETSVFHIFSKNRYDIRPYLPMEVKVGPSKGKM